jgi:hypothetical protein
LYDSDSRLNLNQIDIVDLVKAFGINWELVCYRPKSRSVIVSEFDAIRVEDVALLLIIVERLGFDVDPDYLVDALLPEIKSQKKKILSGSELEIFWFNRCRHKYAPMSLMIDRGPRGETREKIKTTTGYLVELKIDETQKPIRLKITPPKFRKIADPVRTTCKECAMDWNKGDPDSSASHRKEHKRRMAYLDPKPCQKLATEKLADPNADIVTSKSQEWKHFEMYSRALAFKREFRYDFIQWQGPDGDDDPNVQGILFTDERNAIVGACSFRDRTKEDIIKLWGLDWVWLCPKERQHGHLSSRWKELRGRFGDFIVESPVSPEMLTFLKKHNDGELVHHPKDRKNRVK